MNVVIAGLCNVYTHYIATYEEYQVNVKNWGFNLSEFSFWLQGLIIHVK